jgi:hypothetical protein
VNTLLLTAALLWGAPPVQDGSLLFLENSNRFVELYTGEGVTHVAVVLSEGNAAYVYEATPGEVRRIALDDYYAELGRLNQTRSANRKIRVWLAQPFEPYSEDDVVKMRTWLDSQLGRRYSVKSYVRGRSDGIHCAEYASQMLCKTSRLALERCQNESPGSLFEKVKPISRPLAVIQLEEPREQPSFSEQSAYRWNVFANWCQWSCWESLTFCW